MNEKIAEIVNAAWAAGNCIRIGTPDCAGAMAINTPSAIGVAAPGLGGVLTLNPPCNDNRPGRRAG